MARNYVQTTHGPQDFLKSMIVSKNGICWISIMLKYVNIICFKNVWGFILDFLSVFVRNKGCKGPDLVNMLEVPNMIQKLSQCVREP